MTRPLAALALVAFLITGGAWVANAQDGLVELETEVNGKAQILEIDPTDGPVQGVIVKVTVIVEGLVAYETEDGWELAPKTFVTTVDSESPLYGLQEGDSWVIAPAGGDDAEPLDG